MEKFLNQKTVKDAIGVGNIDFVSCSPSVYEAMQSDWMKNLELNIPALLKDGIKSLIYAGEYDLICNWLGNSKWVHAMEWYGQKEFAANPNVSFVVDGAQVGLLKGYGPLSFLKKFHSSMEQSKMTFDVINGLLSKLGEESHKLQTHTSRVHEFQQKNIAEFQKAYEEQSQSESEKLIEGVTSLFSSSFRHQNELVNAKLASFKDTINENKARTDEHTSSMGGITSDAKRKWHKLSSQAENDARDGADFSVAKHCRMELFLQKCVSTVETTSEHWKKTHESVSDISSDHTSAIGFLIRNVSESNEQHDMDIVTTRTAAEEDVAKSNEDILHHFESTQSKCRTC